MTVGDDAQELPKNEITRMAYQVSYIGEHLNDYYPEDALYIEGAYVPIYYDEIANDGKLLKGYYLNDTGIILTNNTLAITSDMMLTPIYVGLEPE